MVEASHNHHGDVMGYDMGIWDIVIFVYYVIAIQPDVCGWHPHSVDDMGLVSDLKGGWVPNNKCCFGIQYLDGEHD